MGYLKNPGECGAYGCYISQKPHQFQAEHQMPLKTHKPVTTILQHVTSAIQNTFATEATEKMETTQHNLIESSTRAIGEAVSAVTEATQRMETTQLHLIQNSTLAIEESVTMDPLRDSNLNQTLIEYGIHTLNDTFEGSIGVAAPTLSTNIHGDVASPVVEMLTQAFQEKMSSTTMISLAQNNTIQAELGLNDSDITHIVRSTLESNVTPMMEVVNTTSVPFDEPSASSTNLIESVTTTLGEAIKNTTSYIKSTTSFLKEHKDFMVDSKEGSHSDHSNAGIYVMLSVILAILLLIGVLLVFIYIRYRKHTTYDRHSYDFCEKPQQPEQQQEDCTKQINTAITFSQNLEHL